MNPHLSSPRSNRSTASNFDGRNFDCGSRAGFLAANVANALERNDVAAGDADGNAWGW
jgi:UTP-glucose-1-phosphate uridylyltransferase